MVRARIVLAEEGEGGGRQVSNAVRTPSWFKPGKVVVSAAPTCGINKDGEDQVDVSDNARRIAIADLLWDDVRAIREGKKGATVVEADLAEIMQKWRAVPTSFDPNPGKEFDALLKSRLPGWTSATIGELIDNEWVIRRDGHGSPSKDQRVGDVPYIKVSDLRAGLVNINPTNMVPLATAKQIWGPRGPGLEPFDLLSPERASSNIGEFCMLMPGQERVVLTREVIVLRVTEKAPFDAFFLHWALSLKVVRAQWKTVIFMQTNRDDVGHRYREIRVPIADNEKSGLKASEAFRAYYTGMAEIRKAFAKALEDEGLHYLTLSGAPDPAEMAARTGTDNEAD